LSFFKGKKRDYLDSKYSKVKFKLFSPPLEEEDEPGGSNSKMYIVGSSQGILPSPGGRERGRGNR